MNKKTNIRVSIAGKIVETFLGLYEDDCPDANPVQLSVPIRQWIDSHVRSLRTPIHRQVYLFRSLICPAFPRLNYTQGFMT